MDSLFSIFLKWVNYSIFMAFSTASIIKPPFANFSLMALVFSLISLYCSAVIAGKISFKSSKESTQMPILFSSTKEAKAAFLQIIRGNRQRRYKEVLCGLLYLRYSPNAPAHSLQDSPSQTSPKSPSTVAIKSSGSINPRCSYFLERRVSCFQNHSRINRYSSLL